MRDGKNNTVHSFFSYLFKILEKLSDRIWIPHQAAYEYQKNRVGKIEEQSGTYKSILIEISKSKNKITGALSSKVHPFVRDTSETLDNLQSVFDEIIDQLEEEKSSCEKLVESDTIRRKIDTLFEGKIGSPYDEERIKEIIIEGEDRYDSEQPPGFEDEKDKIGRRKYGDLILWFQVIDKALEEKLPNILVTDEKKKDFLACPKKPKLLSIIHPRLPARSK